MKNTFFAGIRAGLIALVALFVVEAKAFIPDPFKWTRVDGYFSQKYCSYVLIYERVFYVNNRKNVHRIEVLRKDKIYSIIKLYKNGKPVSDVKIVKTSDLMKVLNR